MHPMPVLKRTCRVILWLALIGSISAVALQKGSGDFKSLRLGETREATYQKMMDQNYDYLEPFSSGETYAVPLYHRDKLDTLLVYGEARAKAIREYISKIHPRFYRELVREYGPPRSGPRFTDALSNDRFIPIAEWKQGDLSIRYGVLKIPYSDAMKAMTIITRHGRFVKRERRYRKKDGDLGCIDIADTADEIKSEIIYMCCRGNIAYLNMFAQESDFVTEKHSEFYYCNVSSQYARINIFGVRRFDTLPQIERYISQYQLPFYCKKYGQPRYVRRHTFFRPTETLTETTVAEWQLPKKTVRLKIVYFDENRQYAVNVTMEKRR